MLRSQTGGDKVIHIYGVLSRRNIVRVGGKVPKEGKKLVRKGYLDILDTAAESALPVSLWFCF
jgi:hypothetical protein